MKRKANPVLSMKGTRGSRLSRRAIGSFGVNAKSKVHKLAYKKINVLGM